MFQNFKQISGHSDYIYYQHYNKTLNYITPNNINELVSYICGTYYNYVSAVLSTGIKTLSSDIEQFKNDVSSDLISLSNNLTSHITAHYNNEITAYNYYQNNNQYYTHLRQVDIDLLNAFIKNKLVKSVNGLSGNLTLTLSSISSDKSSIITSYQKLGISESATHSSYFNIHEKNELSTYNTAYYHLSPAEITNFNNKLALTDSYVSTVATYIMPPSTRSSRSYHFS